jgi:sulfatase modifying factor 1
LSERTGERYRLPSEAEWEFAARGGNSKQAKEDDRFIFSGSNELGQVAWYADNASFDTHPVGLRKANQLGLFDMTGNVWEWCLDDWNEQYDEALTTGDPWKSKAESGRKVIRGGSFNDNSRFCRTAFRRSLDNTDANNQTGFRLVKDPS